ncbi:type II toxin-antitoxin system HicB family antitoxin [candidate division KSB1 bacterium]|nr:type II toxin-antitoxin system HicB family antitoxin [candidate division KSB1 bacterium]
MSPQPVLSEYIARARTYAEYDKLEDGTFSGRIPPCAGVIAFANTLSQCQHELHSVLEDWLLVGFKLRHALPVIDGINLNQKPEYEPLDAV